MIKLFISRVFRTQQKKGNTPATIAGATANIIHQDSNAVPLTVTSAFGFLLQPLTRLNTAIKNAVSKGEEDTGGQEGYRRYILLLVTLFYDVYVKQSCGRSLAENTYF